MVMENHIAFNICEKGAKEPELEIEARITKSMQNGGFLAYDYLGDI